MFFKVHVISLALSLLKDNCSHIYSVFSVWKSPIMNLSQVCVCSQPFAGTTVSLFKVAGLFPNSVNFTSADFGQYFSGY